MSYVFKKTKDPDNRFDNTDVTVELDHNEQSLQDLIEAFEGFLRGCGFKVDLIMNENTND